MRVAQGVSYVEQPVRAQLTILSECARSNQCDSSDLILDLVVACMGPVTTLEHNMLDPMRGPELRSARLWSTLRACSWTLPLKRRLSLSH